MVSCVLMMRDENGCQPVTKNNEPTRKARNSSLSESPGSLQTCCCAFRTNMWSLTAQINRVASLRHSLVTWPMNLQCAKGPSHQRNHPTAATGCFLFWWLKGTCWVWRRKPLIYFRHFSLADSNLKEKEQARSLICLLGMPGSHGSPYRGHLFRSQSLQTHTERWCQRGVLQPL